MTTTTKELIDAMTRHATLCVDIRPKWTELFNAAARLLAVLEEEVEAGRELQRLRASVGEWKGKGVCKAARDRWEAARAATDKERANG